MTFLSKTEADTILQPYYSALSRTIEKAFDRYNNFKDKVGHSPRSRASLIHDFMVNEAEKEFDDIPEVSTHSYRGLFALYFHDKLIIRFKKLNNKLKAANIPTQQALRFDAQEQLSLFPGEPIALATLTAGYVPGQAWTKIEKIAIVCWHNSELLWCLPIEKEEKNVTEFPQQAQNSEFKRTNTWKKPKHLINKEIDYDTSKQ